MGSVLGAAFGNGLGSVIFMWSNFIAPRHIPPLSTSLILLLEVPLAPLFSWAVTHAPPTGLSLGGLGLLLATLVAHEVYLAWRRREPGDGEREALLSKST